MKICFKFVSVTMSSQRGILAVFIESILYVGFVTLTLTPSSHTDYTAYAVPCVFRPETHRHSTGVGTFMS